MNNVETNSTVSIKRRRRMNKRIVYEMITIVLLTFLLTSIFDIRLLRAEPKQLAKSTFSPNKQNIENKLQDQQKNEDKKSVGQNIARNWGLRRPEKLRNLAVCDENFLELIVGVDIPKQQTQTLKETISNEGGKVTGTISIGENARAFTVKVPINDTYVFSEKLLTNKLIKYVEPNFKVEAFLTPNDPYWTQQWGPKKIQANYAWDTTTGNNTVLVCVVDTGIDYTHPDLAANYVPLGYDWVNNDTDPMDDHDHGTHCAGIIAAKLNNSIGIAGLAQVRIMAEKVLNRGGWGSEAWVAQGIIDATDKGAKIISMSLGGDIDSELLHDAVRYAYDHGVLQIAAAGNSGIEQIFYPAIYDEVVAVSATDQTDNLAALSTYGNHIELSAPGVDIYSTVRSNSYASLSGTSMACPHVTGAAALAWSEFANYTRDQILWLLQYSADDLGNVGFDPYYGYGRVNAKKAVEGLPGHDVGAVKLQCPSRLDPGQLGVLNVSVANWGKSNETNVSVELFANETLIDTKTIDFLEATTSTLVSFSWNTTTTGNYNVTCHVVPVTGENSTKNNAVFAHVWVRFSTTLRVPEDYLTIKLAIDNAGSGDTISVNEGYYAEGQINIYKSNITLVANGTAILDGLSLRHVLNIKADYVVVDGLVMQNASFRGYCINMNGYGNNLTNNIIRSAHNYTVDANGGIHVYNSFNCTISQNHVTGTSENGILLEYSSNNTISQNKLETNTGNGGINLYNCTYNTVTLNTITKSASDWGAGICLTNSKNNTITSNNVTENEVGVCLESSGYNVFRNNTMANNTCNFGFKYVQIDLPEYAFNDVNASNTVDGKPICYWVNKRDTVVPPDAGYVVLIDCENITIENLDLRNNLQGVLLSHTNNTRIIQNNITKNHALSSGFFTCGIHFRYCSNITVSSNNITYNQNSIDIAASTGNAIFHNNFINNDSPIYSEASVNFWDDGYPSGGNYWSDYIGLDQFRGTNQGELGSDGIGDMPYVIDVDNTDRYPLMKPYSPHDIGTTYITSLKTIIGQGYNTDIYVKIVNYGVNIENFNITVYANTTIIGASTNVVLTGRNSVTPIVECSTAGVSYGNYTLKAVITTVPGETDTTDNTIIGNIMKVTIPGDITGDFYVNITDATRVAQYWLQTAPPAPSNVDINGDGIISIKDATLVGLNWLKQA
jgi:parallel beta-helix repeat protein